MVNVGAPVFVEENRLYLQSIFFPFEMYTKRRNGISLWPVVKGPKYNTTDYGSVQIIDASTILGDGQLHLFLVNRRLRGSQIVEVKLFGHSITGFDTAEILTGPEPSAMNTLYDQKVIKSQLFDAIEVDAGQAVLNMPPLSVAAITFKVKKNE